MSHPGNSQPLCNYHTLSLGFCCPCLLKAYILDPWARVSGKLKLLLSLEVVYKRVWVSVKFTIIVPSRDHIQAAKCCHLLEQEDLCCCLFSQPCPTLCDPTDSSLPGSSVHECWSCLPFPPPGDLPDPGVEPESPVSPAWQADSLPLSHQELPFCKMGYHLTQVFLYTYKRKHGPQIISKPYFVHWVHGVITGSGETGIVDWSCLRLWTCFSYVFDGFKFTRNCKGNTLISFLGLY